jgi:hypothetical protein
VIEGADRPSSPRIEGASPVGLAEPSGPAAVESTSTDRDDQPEPATEHPQPVGVSTARALLTIGVEELAWAAVVVVAALVRLPALGALPLSLQDSTRAFAAWQVAAGRLPAAWSGDIGQTLTALLFRLFGAGDGVARLAPALFGVALVAAFWFFRPLAGRAPALIAALIIAVSPVCVAVSRSLSPYAAGPLFAIAAAAAALTFLQRPRPAPLAWLAGILGIGLGTDASFILFLIALGGFCLAEGLWKRRAEFAMAGLYLRSHGPVLRSALLIGLAGHLLSTSRFGIAPDRLRSGAATSWSQMFAASSAAVPWHFSLDALIAYEPLLFIGGLICAVVLFRRAGRETLSLCETLLFYWIAGALIVVLAASRRDAGQLVVLLIPLSLAAGLQSSRWLSTARRRLLRPSVVPVLLAFPAFVYVLFVLESATAQATLSTGQVFSLAFLIAAGIGLLILGAIWSRGAAPAFITCCCFAIGLVFALHSLARVGFRSGDEFLLGAVATANAPALAQEVARVSPSLGGVVSVDPALSAPMAWYTRGNPIVRFQSPIAASGAVVQAADKPAPPGFDTLIPGSEIARSWYPAGIDLGGALRWLLYRQAWGPARSTTAQFLLKAGQS